MSDLAENIQLRLLQATTVFEYQVLIVGLNRKSSNDALIALTEEINPQIKVQRIVFDDWGIHRRREIVEPDLRRPLQIGQNLQTRKRTVLLARVIRHADAA